LRLGNGRGETGVTGVSSAKGEDRGVTGVRRSEQCHRGGQEWQE